MSRAILLFSGGLDSILSYFILKHAGVKTIFPIFFETPFFPAEKPLYYAKQNNINLHIFKIFTQYKKVLLHPKYGYGKHLNPCIDCHAFMFQKAIEKLEYFNADFIATGEVVGQRPMSQNKRAFSLMEKLINNHEKLLRPLSAKVLPETIMEKSGLVDRKKLLGITGRGRHIQISLAKKYSIKEYPSPSGGCALTQKDFSNKIKLLIEKNLLYRKNTELIKYGRIIPFSNGICILGRNQFDNETILKLAKKQKKYQIKHTRGPIGIILGKLNKNEKQEFFNQLIKYSKKEKNENYIISFN